MPRDLLQRPAARSRPRCPASSTKPASAAESSSSSGFGSRPRASRPVPTAATAATAAGSHVFFCSRQRWHRAALPRAAQRRAADRAGVAGGTASVRAAPAAGWPACNCAIRPASSSRSSRWQIRTRANSARIRALRAEPQPRERLIEDLHRRQDGLQAQPLAGLGHFAAAGGRGVEERIGRAADGRHHAIAEVAEKLLDQLGHVDAFLGGRVEFGQGGRRVRARPGARPAPPAADRRPCPACRARRPR